MNKPSKFKELFGSEGAKRIVRYILVPAKWTVIVAGIAMIAGVGIMLVTGKLSDFIVSWDVRYNSPAIKFMAAVFLLVMFAALGSGIVMSLHRYRRPGGKGLRNVSYPEGSSYRAIGSILGYFVKGGRNNNED